MWRGDFPDWYVPFLHAFGYVLGVGLLIGGVFVVIQELTRAGLIPE